MIQKEPSEGEEQTDIILLTHRTVEKQRRRRDREDRGAADRARQGRAHPARRAELMRYVSTRGAWADASAAVLGDPARGPRARRRPRGAGAAIRASRASELAALRAARLSRARVRDPVALHRRHSAAPTCAAIVDATYTREIFGSDEITPLADARAGPAPAARVERADARVQGHRAAAARQPVRVRARARGPDDQHPRRDLGRHRQLGRVRDARQARRRPCSCCRRKGRMSPFQTAQMFSLAGRQHPQHRDRGHVRRLPGHREGGQRRRRVQGALRDRRGQLDQLGARRRAGRLLLQGLLRRDARRTTSWSTSPCRRATSATSSPGTSRARWGCRSAA